MTEFKSRLFVSALKANRACLVITVVNCVCFRVLRDVAEPEALLCGFVFLGAVQPAGSLSERSQRVFRNPTFSTESKFPVNGF